MEALKDQAPSKRELQKEARRSAIIDAGFHEFTTKGFTATKLDDVAERAGIGKGTIYLYFDSKESLFAEVVQKNMFPDAQSHLDTPENFQGSASELLALHIREMYSMLHQDSIPSLVAIVLGEATRFPELSDYFFNEIVSKRHDLIRSIIRKGIETGEFRESPIEEYIQILIAPVIFSAIWKLQFDRLSPVDVPAYAEAHIDFILRGLKA